MVKTELKDREVSFSEFQETFTHNVRERSRTSKGVADTSVSKYKEPPNKRGEQLKIQVVRNTHRLINTVWQEPYPQDFSCILAMMYRWDNIINEEITDRRGFRTWEVSYADWHPKPHELGMWIERFVQELFGRIACFVGTDVSSFSGLLAWADREHDRIGHPWADGCGRHSTALIMWLSILLNSNQLPRFGPREQHYATIKDQALHTEYFRECLAR